MTFAGPGKLDDELEAGIEAGATISVESEGEAGRAINAGERVGIQPKSRVRVNRLSRSRWPCFHGRHPSPFGVDAERVPALVEGLIEAGVDWRGLHIFAAAQWLDDNALIQAHQGSSIAPARSPDARIPLPELNLGGGFDVACLSRREGNRRLSDGDGAARKHL